MKVRGRHVSYLQTLRSEGSKIRLCRSVCTLMRSVKWWPLRIRSRFLLHSGRYLLQPEDYPICWVFQGLNTSPSDFVPNNGGEMSDLWGAGGVGDSIRSLRMESTIMIAMTFRFYACVRGRDYPEVTAYTVLTQLDAT